MPESASLKHNEAFACVNGSDFASLVVKRDTTLMSQIFELFWRRVIWFSHSASVLNMEYNSVRTIMNTNSGLLM